MSNALPNYLIDDSHIVTGGRLILTNTSDDRDDGYESPDAVSSDTSSSSAASSSAVTAGVASDSLSPHDYPNVLEAQARSLNSEDVQYFATRLPANELQHRDASAAVREVSLHDNGDSVQSERRVLKLRRPVKYLKEMAIGEMDDSAIRKLVISDVDATDVSSGNNSVTMNSYVEEQALIASNELLQDDPATKFGVFMSHSKETNIDELNDESDSLMAENIPRVNGKWNADNSIGTGPDIIIHNQTDVNDKTAPQATDDVDSCPVIIISSEPPPNLRTVLRSSRDGKQKVKKSAGVSFDQRVLVVYQDILDEHVRQKYGYDMSLNTTISHAANNDIEKNTVPVPNVAPNAVAIPRAKLGNSNVGLIPITAVNVPQSRVAFSPTVSTGQDKKQILSEPVNIAGYRNAQAAEPSSISSNSNETNKLQSSPTIAANDANELQQANKLEAVTVYDSEPRSGVKRPTRNTSKNDTGGLAQNHDESYGFLPPVLPVSNNLDSIINSGLHKQPELTKNNYLSNTNSPTITNTVVAYSTTPIENESLSSRKTEVKSTNQMEPLNMTQISLASRSVASPIPLSPSLASKSSSLPPKVTPSDVVVASKSASLPIGVSPNVLRQARDSPLMDFDSRLRNLIQMPNSPQSSKMLPIAATADRVDIQTNYGKILLYDANNGPSPVNNDLYSTTDSRILSPMTQRMVPQVNGNMQYAPKTPIGNPNPYNTNYQSASLDRSALHQKTYPPTGGNTIVSPFNQTQINQQPVQINQQPVSLRNNNVSPSKQFSDLYHKNASIIDRTNSSPNIYVTNDNRKPLPTASGWKDAANNATNDTLSARNPSQVSNDKNEDSYIKSDKTSDVMMKLGLEKRGDKWRSSLRRDSSVRKKHARSNELSGGTLNSQLQRTVSPIPGSLNRNNENFEKSQSWSSSSSSQSPSITILKPPANSFSSGLKQSPQQQQQQQQQPRLTKAPNDIMRGVAPYSISTSMNYANTYTQNFMPVSTFFDQPPEERYQQPMVKEPRQLQQPQQPQQQQKFQQQTMMALMPISSNKLDSERVAAARMRPDDVGRQASFASSANIYRMLETKRRNPILDRQHLKDPAQYE